MNNEISDLIPHRPPFLLLDEIVDSSADNLTARFVIDERSPLLAQIFAGHYPQNPVTPGVILCEIIFQAGAVLMAKRLSAQNNGAVNGTPVITRIRDAKFKRLVRPNETLEINVKFIEQISNAYYLNGKITVNGELAVKTDFSCAVL